MARPATGEVKTHVRKDGLTSFALRFRAYGQRRFVTLGTDEAGWTPKRAAAELRNTLARVDAGIWRQEESQPIIARHTKPWSRPCIALPAIGWRPVAGS